MNSDSVDRINSIDGGKRIIDSIGGMDSIDESRRRIDDLTVLTKLTISTG